MQTHNLNFCSHRTRSIGPTFYCRGSKGVATFTSSDLSSHTALNVLSDRPSGQLSYMTNTCLVQNTFKNHKDLKHRAWQHFEAKYLVHQNEDAVH